MSRELRALCLGLGVVLVGVSPTGAFASACGLVTLVKGQVQIKGGGAVRFHDKICTGRTVMSGLDGKVRVEMPDRNQWMLMQSGELTLNQYDVAGSSRKVNLKLTNGKVRIWVGEIYGPQESFVLATPGAVSEVKGTDFLVQYDQRQMKTVVTTFKGEVNFASSARPERRVAVRESMQSQVDHKGTLGSAVALERAKLYQIKLAMSPPAQNPLVEKIQVASHEDIQAFDKLIKLVPQAERNLVRQEKEGRLRAAREQVSKAGVKSDSQGLGFDAKSRAPASGHGGEAPAYERETASGERGWNRERERDRDRDRERGSEPERENRDRERDDSRSETGDRGNGNSHRGNGNGNGNSNRDRNKN